MEAVRRTIRPNPKEKANIISIIFFWWTLDLFKTGYKKVLELGDLYQVLQADKSELLGNRLDKYWKIQIQNSNKKPSLCKAIFFTFWREFTFLGSLFAANEIVFILFQPYLLGKLLLYFRKDSDMSHQEAMCYAGGIIICNLIIGVLFNQTHSLSTHYGMKVRIAVCSIIYRKALRLSQSALGDTAFGKIVNLLSNDVNRFEIITLFIHYIWIAPVSFLIIGYLIFLKVRWAGLIGLSVIVIVVPIQSYGGKLSSIFRYLTAIKTDERIKFMDEIICGVQVIKMYAWELPFSKLIALSRKLELKIIRQMSYVRGIFMTFLLFTNRAGIFCTLLSIVLFYGSSEMTAAKIFVISAYFAIVSQTMSQYFVRGIAEIAEASVSLRRLQNFMEYEEKNEKYAKYNQQGPKAEYFKKFDFWDNENNLPDDLAISIKNATARWNTCYQKTTEIQKKTDVIIDKDLKWKPPTLQNINIDVKKGALIGIVGSVGAGKSSLLQLILRELPLETGSISLGGTMSYASQIPWIYSASVRQNILFGKKFNKTRYNAVIEECDLNKDFEKLINGEHTIIGERGVNLSGGQKARVSLARAIYRNAKIYLLDDPLSAVDSHVGRHLFDRCIGPTGRLALQGSTRILVTHQIHFLRDADLIIVLCDGKIKAQGSPNQLFSSGIDIANFLNFHEIEESQSVLRRSRRQSMTLANEDTIDVMTEDSSQDQLQKLEASSKDKTHGSIAFSYFRAGGNFFMLFILFLLFLLAQGFASAADLWVSYWISQEELRQYYHLKNFTNDIRYYGSVKSTIIRDIFGNDTILRTIETDGSTNLLSTETCIYIHASFVAMVFFAGLLRSFAFYTICIRASQSLHDSMFTAIISAPLRFFDINPSGRILNRFSKDMGALDELLPKCVMDSAQFTLNMVGVVFLTAVVNPLFLVPVAILAVIFVFIRKVYLKTSKNIKRLEGICRSPVYTHISASLDGLETIRVFGAQNALINEFDNHQDLHSACFYMFSMTSFAFGITLDIMCMIFICIVTFFFLLFDKNIMGDKVGLALSQIMVLSGILTWGMRQSAAAANHLMSIERILEYSNLNSETAPSDPLLITKIWPKEGKIEFRNVVYRYFTEALPVLQNLSFTVNAKEKIGIVGRTGAGKSSLIGALFRLAIVDGIIIIDDVDTANISLRDLRSKISIIPQDPVLFSGTLRRNLDPFEEYNDNDIWCVLEEVDLKHIAIDSLGLQTIVMAGGCNFSVGQRQLLCLARAILRKNKILILDEATANVDPNTDNLIQNTIRKKFNECTVLTVAHHLHSIMDSDRVLVMDTGSVIEFAAPCELLYRTRSAFREMVSALGVNEANRLVKLAEEKCQSNYTILQ